MGDLSKEINRERNLIILDVLVLTSLACLSLSVSYLPAILALSYSTVRIMFSKPCEAIYIALLFSANTNVFFVSGAPVCNLVLIICFVRVISCRYFIITNLIKICMIVCLYEFLHSPLYEAHTFLQCIVWILSFMFVALYYSKFRSEFKVDKAKLYYLGSILISTFFGCYYRIVSGRGFSVNSFNINERARFGGGFFDPNYFSLSCLILFAFVLERISTSPKSNRYFNSIPKTFLAGLSLVLLFFCIAGLSKSFVILFIILIVLYVPILLSISK